MNIVLRVFWYLLTLALAIYSIPFVLTQFNAWQLMCIWPFMLASLIVCLVLIVGFKLPGYLESKRVSVGKGGEHNVKEKK